MGSVQKLITMPFDKRRRLASRFTLLACSTTGVMPSGEIGKRGVCLRLPPSVEEAMTSLNQKYGVRIPHVRTDIAFPHSHLLRHVGGPHWAA